MKNQEVFEEILDELKKIKTANIRTYEMVKDINAKMIDKINELDLTDAFARLKNLDEDKDEDGSHELTEIADALKRSLKNGRFKL